MRRPPPNAPRPGGLAYTVKADCESMGATDLFVSYEDLAPGSGIPRHRHPHMDEIIIVRHGSGVASLNGAETAVSAGATIFIARDTLVSLRNTGTTPLSIAFIFPHTGYGAYLREWSVPEGEPLRPLTATENAAKQARARWLQVMEPEGAAR